LAWFAEEATSAKSRLQSGEHGATRARVLLPSSRGEVAAGPPAAPVANLERGIDEAAVRLAVSPSKASINPA